MYIPDPIERMNNNIGSMIDDVFSGVPDGKARCMGCKGIFDIDDLHAASGHPDSPVGCATCLGFDV